MFVSTEVDDRDPPIPDPSSFADTLAETFLRTAFKIPKRANAVDIIKATPEYTLSKSFAAEVRPNTLDPLDENLSKRCWEDAVMVWRCKLKDLQAGAIQFRAVACNSLEV